MVAALGVSKQPASQPAGTPTSTHPLSQPDLTSHLDTMRCSASDQENSLEVRMNQAYMMMPEKDDTRNATGSCRPAKPASQGGRAH